MDPLIGQIINQKFRVLRLLGEGGMGKVYVCEQQGIGRKVALKVLHEGLSKIPTVAARFEREAAAAARVIHPNSVTIFDFGRDPNGQLYLAMEYLDGESLAARLKREKRLSVASATAIATQVLETLDACHSAGVIHRDLKPENIFLCPGTNTEVVKILDYGVARVADAPEVTKTGQLVGTPFYMSPEQATGKKVTQSADLYALGVVLFEMLTGRPPYIEKSHLDLFRRHVSAPIPSLKEVSPDRDELTYFESIIQRSLAKKAEDRFASAREMRAAIQRAAGELRAGKLAAFWDISPDSTDSTLISGDESFSGKLTTSMDENGDGAPTSVDSATSTLELSRSMASDARRLGLAKTDALMDAPPSEVDRTVAMGKIEVPTSAQNLAALESTLETPSPRPAPRVVLDNSKIKRAESKPDSSKIPVSVRVPIDDPRIQSARLPRAELPKEPQPYSEPSAESLPFFTAPEHSKLNLSSLKLTKTQAPPRRWPLFASIPVLLAAVLVLFWPASHAAEVSIQSSPAGAKILLNQVERSGVTPMKLSLPLGEVTIEAQKEGCAPTKKIITRKESLSQIVLVLKCQ